MNVENGKTIQIIIKIKYSLNIIHFMIIELNYIQKQTRLKVQTFSVPLIRVCYNFNYNTITF